MLMRCWARDGLSLAEIAKKIGVTRQNLSVWRAKYPEVAAALAVTREEVDYEVEDALLRRALGCKITTTNTIIGYARKDGTRPIRTETTETELPPDVTACLAWLNNRRPDKWKRNRDNFISSDEEKKNQNVTIKIIADKTDKNLTVEQQENE